MKRLLITGGAGFIGCNFVRHLSSRYPDYDLTVLDKLTYAGSRANLAPLEELAQKGRYRFIQGDICDQHLVEEVLADIDVVINFAAETHVDRSLMEPGSFIMTDVYGAFTLLEAARRRGVERFVHISTDEVYGAVIEGASREGDALWPRSPYAASKAGGEMMAHAYHATYELPVVVVRGSNNIGPFQYPEKVVPLFITNAIDDQPLPIYGDGQAVRDYLYVTDFCQAIDLLLKKGQPGEIYNIGAGNEVKTIQLAERILALLGKGKDLMRLVVDRPGHDRRYNLDSSKIHAMGWRPSYTFDQALEETMRWYRDNESWWRPIKASLEYREYYQKNYGHRL